MSIIWRIMEIKEGVICRGRLGRAGYDEWCVGFSQSEAEKYFEWIINYSYSTGAV